MTWDGVLPIVRPGAQTEQDWHDLVAYVNQHRADDGPFDIILSGQTSSANTPEDQEVLAKAAEVGATWWIEDSRPWRFGVDWEAAWSSDATELMNDRIRKGPPQAPNAAEA